MSDLVVKEEVHEVSILTLEDCIIKYKSGTLMRNEAIYEAFLLGKDSFGSFVGILGLGQFTIQKAINHEEAKYWISDNLNISETNSLDLDFGVYSCLKGKSPGEHEDNFQEIYTALNEERLPKSYEIEVFNSLKSSASNGEQLKLIAPIFRHISNGSSSLKRKFRNAPKPFKLKKLFQAIEDGCDESVLISIADTGNKIPTTSSRADKAKIQELESKITSLENRIAFFENSLSRKKIKQFMDLVDYTVKSLKKVGGNIELINALKLIGVESTVNVSELKKAYREKVSIHHPDKGGDDEIFRKIVEANETIKNHIRRITNG